MATKADMPPDIETHHRGITAVLLGSPLLMAFGRALLVPLDDEDWDAVMTSMAENQGRSDLGWLIALAASGLLAVSAVVLSSRLRSAGWSGTALFATVTAALGWAGTAATCANALYLSIAADAPDRAAQVQLQQDLNGAASTGVVFLFVALACVGYIALAVGLARSGETTKWAGALLAIGGVTTLLTMAGPLTPLLVFTALLLAGGHALALRPPVSSPCVTAPS
jgi:hypothetical protein